MALWQVNPIMTPSVWWSFWNVGGCSWNLVNFFSFRVMLTVPPVVQCVEVDASDIPRILLVLSVGPAQ